MSKLSWFLAKRFYKSASGDTHRKASKLAIGIATAGIALGLAVMIISVSVVKGFQQEISNKLTGFSSHVMVYNDSMFVSPESYPIAADTSVINTIKQNANVEHVQRVSQKLGILKTNDAYQTISLKGISAEYDCAFLKSQIIEGELPDYSNDTLASNKIIISKLQAQDLSLKVGQKVYAYFFEETIKPRRFEISAIYETNMPQFDRNCVIAHLPMVNSLNDWQDDQCSQLEVMLKDFGQVDATDVSLGKDLNGRRDKYGSVYMTQSVKNHPHTASAFAWLEVLNTNVWIILVLMVCVAGFTMISGLLILILERTTTIGILKAMGMTNQKIRSTFISYAAMIILKGCLWGNLIGLGIIGLQKHFGWVKLDPESYYVSTAPVLINWTWIISLNIATLFITVMALLVPSLVVTRIQPAKSIRFE